jgi:SAM-dependent methyltransferase
VLRSSANVNVFDRDAETQGGYVYTTHGSLSSRLATQRSTEAILRSGRFAGRSVLDVGCGDGFYTVRYWDQGRPRAMAGIDAAERAVGVAGRNTRGRPIRLAVGDAHRLPYPDDSFDLVLVQSILHHDDEPLGLIREAFRLAPEILIHEPNGNNLGLKVIEKLSPYHREHHEKSYTSRQLARWIEAAGGRVVDRQFAGFVPMFAPDWLARATKWAEPAVERAPLVNALGCAVCIVVASRRPRGGGGPSPEAASRASPC